MPSLADLTEGSVNSVNTPSLLDMVEGNPTRVTVAPLAAPATTGIASTANVAGDNSSNTVERIIDKLFGLNGQERYQLWPEKVVREGLSAAHDVASGQTPQFAIDPATGDVHTSPEMIKAGIDMSSLAGSGGIGGVGSEAGVALGTSPFLRPALKYGEKLYKGKEGQQHLDVIPNDLYPTFQKQAMNGEDISNFNFGFLNHKGQFLSREDALKYAVDNGLVEPQAAQFGALTSTLMADSSKPGMAIEAMANTNKYPLAKPSDRWMNTLGQNDHLIQNMTPDEFLNKSRPLKIDTESRENIDVLKQHIQEGKPLDPLELHANGKEDGRHRAIAAKELGIKEVPVINQRPVKPFYSAVENAVAGAKQPTADAQQWLGFLKNQPGVKQEELAHLGLDKLQGPISKDDLLKAVQEGQPQIKEVIKGTDNPEALAAKKAFDDYGKELGDKYDLNPLQNLAMYRKIKGIKDDEINKYLELQQKYHDLNEAPKTKYHSYQLPGGENYREMLLTLPDKQQRLYEWEYFDPKTQTSKQFKTEAEAKAAAPEGTIVNQKETAELNPSYKSSHWDEPNVLAHIRMNDRTIDGKKSLHLEEIQSDWHQAGRKQGYKDNDKINSLQKEVDDINKNFKPLKELPEGYELIKDGDKWGITPPGQIHARPFAGQWPDKEAAIKSALDKINETNLIKSRDEINSKLIEAKAGIPDAPFKKTWDELALKKAITHAVKNGYDQISWTPGEAQAARYDLSKQVDRLDLIPAETVHNGTKVNYRIRAVKDGKQVAEHYVKDQNEASSIVGKDVAEKLFNSEKNNLGASSLTGDGLKVGGQGMKAFYDKMLVDKANALGKKFGAKVEQKDLNDVGEKFAYINNKSGNKGPAFDTQAEAKEWAKTNNINLDNVTLLQVNRRAKEGVSKQPIHVLKLTPELKEHVLKKGFPLFSAGVPIFTPVDGNPFESKK